MMEIKKDLLKRGFLFYAASTVLLAVQFMLYLWGNNTAEIMDFFGYVFFIASCVSHAAMIALLPYLLYMLLMWLGARRTAVVVQVVLVVMLCVLNQLNAQVYAIYRFHINGFVLNMVFGHGAGEIFAFSTWLYVKELLLFAFIGLVVYGAYWLSQWVWLRRGKAYAWAVMGCFVFCTLFAHVAHIYGSFVSHTSVVRSAKLLPYYFPTTAYSLMFNLGIKPADNVRELRSGGSGAICYPVRKLQTVRPDSLPNIVIILLDSWSKRALTPECMPNAYRFAQENQWYSNHVSGSNGTRSGVYSLFFGLSCYYWEDFEASHITPLLVDRLLELGYDFRAYPSSTLGNPNFAKVLFSKVPNLRTETKGTTSLERDRKLAADFLSDLDGRSKSGKPLFSFLFFDQPHSFELPEKENKRFTPAWPYADYTKLNNSLDPTPFFNLYRNTCFQDDLLLGRIFETLWKKDMLHNTIVILSGDHAQEFNENGKNYWGHNGNFSTWQIGVPLICHFPNRSARKMTYRTTHYDVAPTLMHDYLGVKNPTSDYSMGYLLDDRRPRIWYAVGSNLNYAFIVEGDTILEKRPEGGLDVYDARMNAVTDYHIDVKKFNRAMDRLNRFYRK